MRPRPVGLSTLAAVLAALLAAVVGAQWTTSNPPVSPSGLSLPLSGEPSIPSADPEPSTSPRSEEPSIEPTTTISALPPVQVAITAKVNITIIRPPRTIKVEAEEVTFDPALRPPPTVTAEFFQVQVGTPPRIERGYRVRVSMFFAGGTRALNTPCGEPTFTPEYEVNAPYIATITPVTSTPGGRNGPQEYVVSIQSRDIVHLPYEIFTFTAWCTLFR
jgi:hypothetical protein